jgi:peptidoglycan/LPS O-acetylase OafA/YrhL
MAKPSSRHILGLNGLRALSVIAIFLTHKWGLRYYIGPMSVWTFLAISGFLLIVEMDQQRIAIESGDGGVRTALRVFFTKRAIRIFPAYFGILALLFLLRRYYAWAGPDLGFRYHFFYLSNFWISYVSPNGGPFGVLWTLAEEQQFYAFAPFIFLLAPSRSHIAVCLIIVCLAAIAHLAMQQFGVSPLARFMTSPWNFAIICLGGAAGILRRDPRFVRIMRGWPALAICVGGIIAYTGVWTPENAEAPTQAAPLFAVSCALAGLVAWVSVNQDSLLVRGLEWRPLEHLGVISYGFYLIHNFVPNPLGRVLPLYFGVTASPMLASSLGVAFVFILTYGLAHLSWTHFERPLLGLRSRLLPGRASRKGLVVNPAERKEGLSHA